MSETTTDPQGGATSAEPAAPEAGTPAPVNSGAATETTDDTTDPPKPSRLDRRVAALSARLSAKDQEIARLAAVVEQHRRQSQPEQAPRPPTAEDIPRLVEERVAAVRAQERAQERSERFHGEGRAAFPDWTDKCSSLMQMGADAQFAELLIETPNGARVAAALADDPEELERITGLRTERARAIALGKYAAAVEARPNAGRPVSRAPAPIRPIGAGAARVEVNPLTMTAQQLVEMYSREAAAKRNA